MTERAAFRGLLLCLVLSGLSGLIYEVAWVRSLELIFGATSFAVATVLASFMGGLAAGSWLAGRLAPRLAPFHPLRVYAAIELSIGCVALAIPPAFRALVPVYQGVARHAQTSFAAFSLLRFLLSVLVLLVPTALMGATLPVVCRVAAALHDGDAARRIGQLYAVNTCGAVAGCALAGFVFLPALGLLRTQWLAVVFNLMPAAGAFYLAQRLPWKSEFDRAPAAARAAASSKGASDAGAGTTLPGAAAPAWRPSLLVATYAVSGGVAMLYEVAWSRFLVLVLGSSTYSYTIMLTTFLLGLALGAAWGSRLLRGSPDPLLAVGLCQILIGVATYLALFVAGELPYLYHLLHDRFHPGAGGLLAIQLLLAAAVMILPTVGLGMMFPLTMGGLDLSTGPAQAHVGRVYAWNTTGAIVGSLLAGFWLIPRIGSRNVLIAGVAVNALLALAALTLAQSRELTRRRRTVLVGLIAIFLVNLFVAAPSWRPEMLSSGIFRYADRYAGLDRATFRERMRQSHGDILMFQEGLTCTVTVFRTTKALTLMVNGKPDASVPPGLAEPVPYGLPVPLGDLPTQVLLGQLPLLMALRIDDVLVIGLGSGVTLGSVATQPVKRVDCIELEKAVVNGSRFFDQSSGAPLGDARVRLLLNDARNELLVRDDTYDVMISEPSNPWIPGAASLFTRDFFRLARARLRPDGIFCQWVQLYELWPQDFAAILRSFTEVFPSAQIYRVGSDAVILGGATDLALPLARLRARFTPAVRADLSRIGIQTPEDLLAHYWIGGRDLRAALPDAVINTDDNMRIEFAAPLRMLARDPARIEQQSRELNAMFRAQSTGLTPSAIDWEPADRGSESGFMARVAMAAGAHGYAPESLQAADASLALERNPTALLARCEALASVGRLQEARDALDAAGREFPRDAAIQAELLRVRSLESGAAMAAGPAGPAGLAGPTEPVTGQVAASSEAAPRAVSPEHQAEAAQARERGQAAFVAGRLAEARAAFEAGLALSPADDPLSFLLARTLRRMDDRSGAVQVIEAALRQHPDRPWALGFLAQVLGESGATGRAEAIALRYRALMGDDWNPIEE